MTIINNQKPTVGIVADDTDNVLSALLFDFIIPIHRFHEVPAEVKFPTSFEEILKNPFFYFKKAKPLLLKSILLNNQEMDGVDGILSAGFNYMIIDILKKINKSQYTPIPIFYQTNEIFRIEDLNKNSTKNTSVEVELINAPIINTTGIKWDQVIEAKNDLDFKKKVRNFSLFITENYDGKSVNYISDSLEKNIEDYKRTLSKHGFGMGIGTIKEVINSKSLWGVTALTLLNSLIGSPGFVMTTGFIGAVLEIGSLRMKISEKERALSDFQENSEVAFLIKLEQMKQKYSS